MENQAAQADLVAQTKSTQLSTSLNEASSEQRSAIVNRLQALANVQQLYGKDAGALAAGAKLIMHVCGKYPADKVAKAIELWMERESTFPTPSDIAGIVKRGGKPPLERSIYIAISKKEGFERTGEDWKYLSEYEAEMMEGSLGDEPDKVTLLVKDNERLRKENKRLQSELERVNALLNQKIVAQEHIAPRRKTADEKVQLTIDYMEQTGAPQEDIEQFKFEMGVL